MDREERREVRSMWWTIMKYLIITVLILAVVGVLLEAFGLPVMNI
jgi:uncharacterized membrane protein